MQFDPNNKVVQLCVQGMQIEAEGNIEEAHILFLKAWEIAENDMEAFTAAHYVARNQKAPEDELKWNLEALNRANAIKDQDLNGNYPSLYLNVGKSYETLGDFTAAAGFYKLAADFAVHLPPGGYGDMTRGGINAALDRVSIGKT